MSTEVYKPYKKSPEAWGNVEDEKRVVDGKSILCMEIGRKLIENENGEILEEYLYEDIYENTIRGIFQAKKAYKTFMTLNCEPKLVITYDGIIISHNDKVPGYIDTILQVLQEVREDAIVTALIDFTLNQEAEGKISTYLKRLTRAVNTKSESNFPTELVGFVVKQYYCDMKRNLTERQEELKYNSSYEELLREAGKVLINRETENVDVQLENDLLNELLYRFIEGKLIEKR